MKCQHFKSVVKICFPVRVHCEHSPSVAVCWLLYTWGGWGVQSHGKELSSEIRQSWTETQLALSSHVSLGEFFTVESEDNPANLTGLL